jgi:cell wall-associated NlpC family hydrolase
VVTEATIPDDVGSGREGSLASAQTSPLALEALTRQSMTATAVRVRVERDTAIRAAVHRQPVTPTTRPTRAQTPSKASRSSQRNTHTGGRSATPTTGNGGDPRPVPGQAAKGSDVLAIAARYVRVPYRYGGTTPAGFDCSGYVKYVYARLGISLPRKADQQMRATTQVQRSQTRPGDIVSFVSGGRVYHNGIYAGNGMMYDAPRTGQFVSKRAIWTATVVYTRVSTS